MPHILVQGCDMTKGVQILNIHADVTLKQDYFLSPLGRRKLEELKEELERVAERYFDIIESEELSNHEYNLQTQNQYLPLTHIT